MIYLIRTDAWNVTDVAYHVGLEKSSLDAEHLAQQSRPARVFHTALSLVYPILVPEQQAGLIQGLRGVSATPKQLVRVLTASGSLPLVVAASAIRRYAI